MSSLDNPHQHAPRPISAPEVNTAQHMPSAQVNDCIGTHPSAQYKVELLSRLAQENGCKQLVETGLYSGHGSGMAIQGGFNHYAVIDFQPENCRIARQNNPDALVICDDSAIALPRLLKDYPRKPTLFWLDAHGVPGDVGFPGFPLITELEAIAEFMYDGSEWTQCVVAIDDLCFMGGMLGSPPLSVLRDFVNRQNCWHVSEANCIMTLIGHPGHSTAV